MIQSSAVTAESPPSRRHRWRRWVAGTVLLAATGTALVPECSRWQARRALAVRDFETAADWLAVAEQFPWSRSETAMLKARWMRRQGRTAETADWLARAQRAGANRKRIEREQWMTLAQLGNMGEAEPHLPELLADPGDDTTEICEAYASGYIFLRRFADALKLLDAWILDEPGSLYARLLRGRVYYDRAQPVLAEADFRAALTLDSKCDEAHLTLGRILQDANRQQEAIAEFRLCQKSPWREDALLAEGVSLRTLGQNEQAMSVLKDARTLSPGRHEVLYEIGRLERETGNAEAAVTTLRAAVAANPGNSDYQYALAQALQEVQQFEEANALLAEVQLKLALRNRLHVLSEKAEANPRDIEIRRQLGEICFQLDRPEEAIGWLRSVLELDPKFRRAHEALARYYRANAAKSPEFLKRAQQHEAAASESVEPAAGPLQE